MLVFMKVLLASLLASVSETWGSDMKAPDRSCERVSPADDPTCVHPSYDRGLFQMRGHRTVAALEEDRPSIPATDFQESKTKSVAHKIQNEKATSTEVWETHEAEGTDDGMFVQNKKVPLKQLTEKCLNVTEGESSQRSVFVVAPCTKESLECCVGHQGSNADFFYLATRFQDEDGCLDFKNCDVDDHLWQSAHVAKTNEHKNKNYRLVGYVALPNLAQVHRVCLRASRVLERL